MDDRRETFRLIVKSLLAAALIALVVAAVLRLSDLLVVAFGAVVVAVLLRGFADAIERHSPISGGWALTAALLIVATVLAAMGWLFGTRVQGQFQQLAEAVPAVWNELADRVRAIPGGQELVESIEGTPSASGDVLSRLAGVVRSLTSALTEFLLLLFGAVFIAADPALYRRGLVLLVPKNRRDLADEALGEAGAALRKWMLGQFVSMGIVGLLTGIGLWLIGVPSAVALGLIAAVSEVVPWAGPIIASVPIVIMALTESPQTALLALALILAVQQVEGNLIMPYVQKKAVSLPPALTVFGVVAGGLLFGPIGLIFAAPLLVVGYVLVKRLYVEEALGTPTPVPGRPP